LEVVVLSHGLLQTIERESEVILALAFQQIRSDPDLEDMKKVSEVEWRTWGSYILGSLKAWLMTAREAAPAGHQEFRSQLRFKEPVPLPEVVKALHILKNNIVDFVRDQGVPETPLETFAECEVEHVIGEFFDGLEEHLVHRVTDLRPSAYSLS
jgi:hypothetical protein